MAGPACQVSPPSSSSEGLDLVGRIGDAAFRHLLVHTSLFLPVGNNCFMQLSGVPIYDKYQHCHPTSKPDRKRPFESVKPSGRRSKKRRKTIDHEDHEERVNKYVVHFGQKSARLIFLDQVPLGLISQDRGYSMLNLLGVRTAP